MMNIPFQNQKVNCCRCRTEGMSGCLLKALGWIQTESRSVEESTSFAEGKTSPPRGVRVTTHHGCALPLLLTLRLVSPSDLCVAWQEPQSFTWHWPAASSAPGSSILEDPALSSSFFFFWSPHFLFCSTQLLREALRSQRNDIEKKGCWKMSISLIVIQQEAPTSSGWSAARFRRCIAWNVTLRACSFSSRWHAGGSHVAALRG